MTFLWPTSLWLLCLLPVMVALYVHILRRRKKFALSYSNLALVKSALGASASWRRHVPPAIFLASFAFMLLALARPAAVMTLPSQHETVILAMDVSGSMRADDVKPTRLAAAQAAARAFLKDTLKTTRVGLVAFAGSAALVQAPTHNRDDIQAAIEALQLQNATAVGSGILVSLKAIFPDQDFEIRSFGGLRAGGGSAAAGGSRALGAPKSEVRPVPPGSYKSAVVILLTDGQILTGEGWSIRVRLDEDALKVIADMTRGEYFFAGNAPDLKKIYEGLNSKLVMEKKETEVTAVFTAVAAMLALLAAAMSLLWFNRLL